MKKLITFIVNESRFMTGTSALCSTEILKPVVPDLLGAVSYTSASVFMNKLNPVTSADIF